MRIVRPLHWIDYNKNLAIEFLEREYGWKYYGGKHLESKWTRFFQTYYLPVKFGYDKRRAHLSSMIVAGQVGREEALRELGKLPYDMFVAQGDKRYVADKLEISVEQLEAFMALPNKDFKDYPSNFKYTHLLRKLSMRLQENDDGLELSETPNCTAWKVLQYL